MRAFVIDGPGSGAVQEVETPVAARGEVVVDVERVGLCGTDLEFFAGTMPYLRTGEARYPIRIGHEWCGLVTAVGAGVDPAWIGRVVTGDTMLGCGSCERCTDGRQHLCADRVEVGVKGGWPGALAEQVKTRAVSLHVLPDTLDLRLGALVEPGANALRAYEAASLQTGDRLLVAGVGTIGMFVAMFARADGVEVHLVGRRPASLAFARSLGFERVTTLDEVPRLAFDAIVDASNGVDLPAAVLDLAEPGRRVVYIGLAPRPSLIDSRIIAMKDLTVVGVLGGSSGLGSAIGWIGSGRIDPRPLVAATIPLDDVGAVLGGARDPGWGAAPKVHVDPHAR
jgi:threonine dehydrogenase-like Zn-dependent dehydrogenase